MNKYLVLYRAPIASFEKVMQAPPEEAKAGMDAWMAWSKKAASSIVDMGAPLGKTLRVDPKGASPTKNELGGYSIMQAESKEALASHGGVPFLIVKGRKGGSAMAVAAVNALASEQE